MAEESDSAEAFEIIEAHDEGFEDEVFQPGLTLTLTLTSEDQG
jgi:hypothetical protein